MRLIVDTNIVISAIMSPSGVIARLIFNKLRDYDLLAPHYLVEEIRNKEQKILNHTGYTKDEFDFLQEKLFQKIELIDEEIISENSWREAYELTKDVDPKDSVFVALSLTTKVKIWSSDNELIKGLSKKGFEDFIQTKTLREEVE